MNQCHECGNELTEVDAFCPFCGIVLAPTVVEEEVDPIPDEPIAENSAKDEVSESEPEFADIESVFDNTHAKLEAPDKAAEKNETSGDSDGFVDSSSLVEDPVAADLLVGSSEEAEAQEIPDLDEKVDEEVIAEVSDKAEYGADDSVKPIEVEVSAVSIVEESENLVSPDGTVDEEVIAAVSDDAEQGADESVDQIGVEVSSEVVVEEPEIVVSPDENAAQIEETPTDSEESEDFLEDSTMIMSSFPKIEREDVKEDEAALENRVIANDSGEVGSEVDVTDLESETILVSSGSLDLPPASTVETPEASADAIPDETASKTIGYVPSDFEELKHIDASDRDMPAQDDEAVVDNDSSKISDGSDAGIEVVPEVISDLNEVDVVAGAIPSVEDAVEVSSADIMTDDAIDSNADESPFEQVDSLVDEPVHSETTPNIGVEDTDGSNKTKLKPLDEGTVLNNRYEIVRKIGGGGMGAVYLANDKNLGGVLRAVKEMVQSYIEEEQQEKAINDFKRESMLLTSLEHSSIPTIYDYFFDETEGRFYLVMKYISGGDLSGKIRSAPEGKLDEKSVVEWGSQIADVLDYLHNRQPPIVYRDLKPANVMVDGNSGKVMLIDFGIARWVNKEEKGVTAVGTMGYAPPELFSGNVEPRSDIYSLGSTMFHLLTGADPQSNPLLIFDFQKHPRPRQINPALSDQVEQILMKAVEYSADQRFSSAAEMRDALVAHSERLESGGASYGINESPKAVGLSDLPVFCGFCGQKIVATDMFCAFCGAKQPLAQPGVHAEEYAPVGVSVKLLVEGTSDLDAPAFSLVKDDNLLGRRDPISDIFPEVDLSKFDPQTKISRKHARIWRDGDKFMLEDLNSSNGTLLRSPRNESVRLSPHQSHVLTNGDKIQMGDTILHFLVG